MGDERWRECKHHHHGCACREHQWEEQLADREVEIVRLREQYNQLRTAWNEVSDIVRARFPVELGYCHLRHGIPRMADALEAALAEIARLKGETE